MACKLEVEPSEVLPLIADGSSSNLNATITLRNTHIAPMLFRIQTTSPLSYRVKPSHGWVLSGSIQTVTVLHVGQANASSTASVNGGKTDKFLIKYGAADQSEVLPERDSPQASEKFTQLVFSKNNLFVVVGYAGGHWGMPAQVQLPWRSITTESDPSIAAGTECL